MPYEKDKIPPLSEEAKNFKTGRYKHFKGMICDAICVGRSSEDRHEEFVVYREIEDGRVWIRPLKMFVEQISRDGYTGPRFELIEEKKYEFS